MTRGGRRAKSKPASRIQAGARATIRKGESAGEIPEALESNRHAQRRSGQIAKRGSFAMMRTGRYVLKGARCPMRGGSRGLAADECIPLSEWLATRQRWVDRREKDADRPPHANQGCRALRLKAPQILVRAEAIEAPTVKPMRPPPR